MSFVCLVTNLPLQRGWRPGVATNAAVLTRIRTGAATGKSRVKSMSGDVQVKFKRGHLKDVAVCETSLNSNVNTDADVTRY